MAEQATQNVGHVMSTDIVTLQSSESVVDAAKLMREKDIGNVVVMQDDQVYGIVTDRDIVVRAIAEGRDLISTRVEDVASKSLATVSSATSVREAAEVMSQHAVRRLPVVDEGKLVGIVSIGDLAEEQEPESALGGISEAPPNV